ncbi:klaroid protein isoform X1 [Drosophila gunungcola]|uniref:klaroid protein isoform X1 n=1 Tax=Drosophila gunungcola TaxID=103775 RepID=UPI0022E70C83|nr:klaroid protein isoform X1 [Drosophila gunungcola]
MSEDTYQIETRRRSRSKTPFLLAGDNQPKKKSTAPNVQTIVEEHVVESSSSKQTRSKAFAQLTSDYSSDDMTPEAKRKQTSTTTTVTSIITKRSGGATSTPRNRSQLETTQNTLNSAQEKLNHSNGNLSSGNVSDYLAYIEYRDAGEYWNKTPKTDYTYSELSPHRRQLAPGVVAMPNMSRRSLANHDERVNYMVQQNPGQEEFIRRRYQSKYTQQANYDSADELDATFGQQQKQSWWLVRLIQLVVSSVTTVWTRVTNLSATETNAYQNYYARRQQSQQTGLLGKVAQAVGGGFASLLRYLYIFIGSVLSLDTWLLRSSDAENKSKKRFLIVLLILLPLLLLTGWSLLQEDQRMGYVQRAEALLPLPLALFGSLQSRLSFAGAALRSLMKEASVESPQQEAEAIKLNMASIERNIQKALTAEEYENILNHVNSYVQQLVELKMQQQSKQLPPQQVQLIVQLMKENLQQLSQKTQLTEQDLADLAIKLKHELQRSGGWQDGAKLSQANLEEINRLIKSEVHLHESHYTIQLEKIDFAALLERILSAPELADFVDARIHLQVRQIEPRESSGSPAAEIQIDSLNREIAFIKLALSDKQAENADLHQSISNLKLGQEDLLERMQRHELAQDRRFSGLLAEIESKLSSLNDSQFALLNKQIKLSLVEILGFKQSTAGGAAGQLDDVDLQNWVRSMFVAKDYLEQQLLELNKRTNNNIRDEIERSSILLMSDISERLKREMLLVVEAKHNESTKALKGHIREEEVRQIVKTVLAIYDADKTGLVDFALESAGGQILSTRCTESYQTKSAQISVFGIPLWYPTNTPRVAISPNVQPGECWAFQGFPGFLVLKLNSLVYVTGFTLEHIPKSLSPTGRIDSAPKNFTVWGLEQEKDQDPVLFGEYQFEDNGASLQYFAVQSLDIKRPYDIVELRIETNHGQPTYTCLYRFRVHGKPPAT